MNGMKPPSALGQAAANIAGAQNVAAQAPMFGLDDGRMIFRQAQIGGIDPATQGYAGQTQPYAPMTASEWINQNVRAIESLKKVMEYVAAQEAMELFKDDPIAAQIFRTFVREGMKSLMGIK